MNGVTFAGMNFDNWANRSLDTGTQAMFGYLPVLIFVPYLINNNSSSKWQGEEGRIFCYWLWTDVRAQVCSAGLSENTRQGRLDVCGPQRNCSQVANRQMWLTSLFVLSHSIQSIMRGNKYQHVDCERGEPVWTGLSQFSTKSGVESVFTIQ